jgi:GNAT superfamily N-acetyltransferase
MRQCYAIHFDGHCVARANIMLATNELVELWVDQSFRREGLGRRLLKLVCNEADREGVVLKLMAAGSEGAMSTKQLEAWYGRFGFVSNPSCMMVRKPRTKL